jgi:hypothetical protein
VSCLSAVELLSTWFQKQLEHFRRCRSLLQVAAGTLCVVGQPRCPCATPGVHQRRLAQTLPGQQRFPRHQGLLGAQFWLYVNVAWTTDADEAIPAFVPRGLFLTSEEQLRAKVLQEVCVPFFYRLTSLVSLDLRCTSQVCFSSGSPLNMMLRAPCT